ncbi:MAG: hypothetical protein GVY16_00195 [Planctomycetes bacterium]|nr:hypothetical protein [Phycisphaerae bacterium]NBB94144.1 hypothetical protein [Planctomycetota bacterium]
MCPFLDHADPRCSAQLNLRNISKAFAHCAGRFEACPLYQELRHTAAQHEHPNYTVAVAYRAAS